MKKLIITIIGLIGLLSITSSDVFAAEYKYHNYVYEGDKIDNIYFKNKDDTLKEAHIYKINDSNKLIYSIEYENDLEGASRDDYDDTFDYRQTNLTNEQAIEINLIGYYGYNYKSELYDHTDIKWYAITQYLIWQIETNNELNGIVNENGESIFASEIEEINKLIENHYIKPDFGAESFKVKAFDEITLEDNNEVLEYYTTKEYFGLNYEVQDNKIIATSNKNKTHTIYLTKSDTRFSRSSTFYISNTYRNAMEIGKYEDISTSIKISFISGKVTINKMGEQLIGYEDNKFIYEYKQATGVVYQLFAKNDIYNNVGKLLYHKDELVSELVIGEKESFDNLYLSEYYALETYTPYAYHVTGNPYKVNLSFDVIGQAVTFRSPYQPIVIRFGTMKQTVSFNDGIKYGLTPLANAKFGLFAGEDIFSDIDSTTPIVKKDTLLDIQTSDTSGSISFKTNVPVGKYYIVKLDNDNNYHGNSEKLTLTFNVDHSVDRQYFYLNNYYDLLNTQSITFQGDGHLKIFDEERNLIMERLIEGETLLDLPFGNYYYQFEDNDYAFLEVNDSFAKVIILKKEDKKDEVISGDLDSNEPENNNPSNNEEFEDPKIDNEEKKDDEFLDESDDDKTSVEIVDNKPSKEEISDNNKDNIENDSNQSEDIDNPQNSDFNDKEEEENSQGGLVENPPMVVLPNTSTRPNHENKNEDVSMDVITPPSDSSDILDNQEETLPSEEEKKEEENPEIGEIENDKELDNSSINDVIDEDTNKPIIDEEEKEELPDEEKKDVVNKPSLEENDKEETDNFNESEEPKEDVISKEETSDNDNYSNDENIKGDNKEDESIIENKPSNSIEDIIKEESSEESNDNYNIPDNSDIEEIPIENTVDNSKDDNVSLDKEDDTSNDDFYIDVIDGDYDEINVKVPSTDKNDYSLIIYIFMLLISSLSLIHAKE